MAFIVPRFNWTVFWGVIPGEILLSFVQIKRHEMGKYTMKMWEIFPHANQQEDQTVDGEVWNNIGPVLQYYWILNLKTALGF